MGPMALSSLPESALSLSLEERCYNSKLLLLPHVLVLFTFVAPTTP